MNKLSGPVNIFNLKVCKELLLGGNKFNESLPSNIQYMGSLSKFYLTMSINFEDLNFIILLDAALLSRTFGFI